MIKLVEGRKEFIAWAGGSEAQSKDLLDKFLEFRKKVSGNEADMDWWVKNKTPKELEEFMSNFKSKTAKEKEERIAGSEKLYEDSNWLVIWVKTYDAAKQLGKGSKWCICGNYPGHESRGEYYFNKYLKDSYEAYYLYVNKHPTDHAVDGKYMVCSIIDDPLKCDIWNQADNKIDFIKGAPVIPGLPSAGQYSLVDGKLLSYKIINGEVNIPEETKEIKPNLFFSRSGVDYVRLNNGLEKIGSGAFSGCQYLYKISIPDSVTYIGQGAFINSGLKHIEIGRGVTELKDKVFAYTNDPNVYISGVINKIDDTCFKGCKPKIHFINGFKSNAYLLNWCKDHKIEAIDNMTLEVV